MVDTWSPVRLLKIEFVPNNYFVIKPVFNTNFSAINSANYVIVHNNIMNFNFHIVSNNSISTNVILGRDLLSKPGFKI